MGQLLPFPVKQQPTATRRGWQQDTRLGHVTPEQVGTWLSEGDRTGDIRNTIRLYWKLLEDPSVAADFTTRRANVVAQPYRIEKAGDHPDDAECAQTLERVLQDMGMEPPLTHAYSEDFLTFDEMCSELLEGPAFAFSAVETPWAARGGLVVPTGAWRCTQDRFRWPQGHPPLLADDGIRISPSGTELVPGGWVVHIPRANPGSRMKAGCFRSVAFLWVFKNHAWRYYMRGAEMFSFPWLHAKLKETPGGANTHDSAALDRAMKALQDLQSEFRTATAGIEEIKLLESSQKDAQLLDRLMGSINREISKAILGHTDSTEPTKVGAYGAVKTRNGFTAGPRIAQDEQALAVTLRKQFTRVFWALNSHRWPNARIPWIRRDVGTPTPIPEALWGKGLFTRNDWLSSFGRNPEPVGIGDQPDSGGSVDFGGAKAIEPTATLNGAQVTSLQGIVTAAADGTLPRETAIELMLTAFPIDRAQALRIMGDIGKGAPLSPPEPVVGDPADGDGEGA